MHALTGYLERLREELTRLTEASGLCVKHAHVVEDPRQRLGIVGLLEGLEAFRVELGRGCVVAAHVRENSAILLDHSQKACVSHRFGECGSGGIKPLRVLVLSPALVDYRLAVERVCFGANRT